MVTCKRCGVGDLHWQHTGDKYWLEDSNLNRHHCSADIPITRVDQVNRHDTASLSDANVKAMARDAVTDAVAEIQPTFMRNMDAITSDAIIRMRETTASAIDDAIESFRLLMPQQHEIHVRTPLGDREMKGKPHRQLQELVDWLSIKEHVWASGPAGSGKTYAAEQAADMLGLPAYTLPCGMSTNDWSLLGFKNPDGKYIPGHMRQPYEHGGVFILDEIDNTPASVMTTINSALSGSHYTFPDGDVIRHPDFRVVGCANTWGHGANRVYVGRNQLDAATLDRFQAKIAWAYDEDAEFDWAGRDQSLWVAYVQRVRAQVDIQSMRVVVSPRSSISGANALRNGFDAATVTRACLWLGMSDDDSARLLEVVGEYGQVPTPSQAPPPLSDGEDIRMYKAKSYGVPYGSPQTGKTKRGFGKY